MIKLQINFNKLNFIFFDILKNQNNFKLVNNKNLENNEIILIINKNDFILLNIYSNNKLLNKNKIYLIESNYKNIIEINDNIIFYNYNYIKEIPNIIINIYQEIISQNELNNFEFELKNENIKNKNLEIKNFINILIDNNILENEFKLLFNEDNENYINILFNLINNENLKKKYLKEIDFFNKKI